ncbi:MAG: glycosyltransferase family A protein [Pseudomonadota bacterium]
MNQSAFPCNTAPRFSVVIPLFNKAPHVEAAVRSALAQSFAPVEIIVVDDGSTDGGLAIVEAMAGERLVILERSPPGPGGYAARNLGIRSAQGNWVAFLDADDLWHEHHLADLAQAIIGCPEPVGCGFTCFDIVSDAGRRRYPHSARLLPGRALPLSTMIAAWLDTERCPIWTGASAFRRDLLIAAGLFPDGRTHRGGDKDMWLRAMAAARSVFVDRVSAEFHQDTVNRVTRSARHSEKPLIVETIAALMETTDAESGALLKRLSNQELLLYARHSAGSGVPFDRTFFTALREPMPRETIAMAGYWLASFLVGLRRGV